MASLILGPMARWASTSEATVWVETDERCEVEVTPETGEVARAKTFAVEGHHYAIVRVSGLPEDAATPYTRDARRRAGVAGARQPVPAEHAAHAPQAREGADRVRLVPDRLSAPPAATASPRTSPTSAARSTRCARSRCGWRRPTRTTGRTRCCCSATRCTPTRCRHRRSRTSSSRRDTTKPPHEGIANFEEYTQLYRESWSDPPIRWLLSTVPSAMIFDDHDVIDDWNTSLEWVEEMRATDWWDDARRRRLHELRPLPALGQPVARTRSRRRRSTSASATPATAANCCATYAYKSDREVEGARWSYCRDIGCTRVVMIDSRAGRVLTPGDRSMVDAGEWDWITEHAHRRLRPPADRHVAAAVPRARAALPRGVERGGLRRRLGLARPRSWGRSSARASTSSTGRRSATRSTLMCGLLREVGAGRRGPGAARRSSCCRATSTTRTSREVGFPKGSGVDLARLAGDVLAVPQPAQHEGAPRRDIRLLARCGERIGRVLARSAGVPAPPVRWRFQEGDPRFDNQVGTLELDERDRAGPPRACDPVRSRACAPDLEIADERRVCA